MNDTKIDITESSLYIAVEGMDGSGKSTITNYIADKLNSLGTYAISTHEVGGTPIGKLIREICFTKSAKEVLQPEARLLLVAASRIQIITELVKPHLRNGFSVVSDRCNFSSFVYDGLKAGNTRLLEILIENIEALKVTPDYMFYLHVDYEIAYQRHLERVKVDNDLYKVNKEMFRETQMQYEQIYTKFKTMHPNKIIKIDANCDIENVKKQIDEYF